LESYFGLVVLHGFFSQLEMDLPEIFKMFVNHDSFGKASYEMASEWRLCDLRVAPFCSPSKAKVTVQQGEQTGKWEAQLPDLLVHLKICGLPVSSSAKQTHFQL
jgi:hypothetical protein